MPSDRHFSFVFLLKLRPAGQVFSRTRMRTTQLKKLRELDKAY